MVIGAAPNPVTGPEARRAAQEELHHSQYGSSGSNPLGRFVHWLDHLGGVGGASRALLILLVVLLAVAIVFAVRAGVPSRSRRRVRGDAVDPLAPADALDHRRLAEQLAAAGRRDEALREWLRAAVATIEERGVLPPRPGRTGAATAAEAGPLLPSAADGLRAATAAFDRVWYGGRPATDDDVARASTAADAVRDARLELVR